MRKPRTGEAVCNCRAYKFPHRFGGGKCHGHHIVHEVWGRYYGGGPCSGCHLLEEEECGRVCLALDGREKVSHCPEFDEYVAENGIRLLGPYWKDTRI